MPTQKSVRALQQPYSRLPKFGSNQAACSPVGTWQNSVVPPDCKVLVGATGKQASEMQRNPAGTSLSERSPNDKATHCVGPSL